MIVPPGTGFAYPGAENEGPALGVVAGSGPCPASREQRLNRRLRPNHDVRSLVVVVTIADLTSGSVSGGAATSRADS
jgi:hypothetical protein